jgi:hypothetical protein
VLLTAVASVALVALTVAGALLADSAFVTTLSRGVL